MILTTNFTSLFSPKSIPDISPPFPPPSPPSRTRPPYIYSTLRKWTCDVMYLSPTLSLPHHPPPTKKHQTVLSWSSRTIFVFRWYPAGTAVFYSAAPRRSRWHQGWWRSRWDCWDAGWGCCLIGYNWDWGRRPPWALPNSSSTQN